MGGQHRCVVLSGRPYDNDAEGGSHLLVSVRPTGWYRPPTGCNDGHGVAVSPQDFWAPLGAGVRWIPNA